MSFPGMGGDNSVSVEINGNSAALVDALAMAQDALAATSASMAAVGAASEDMAAASAAGVDGLEAEGAAATTAAGRLDGLLASVRAAAAGMADLAGVMSGGVGSAGLAVGNALEGSGVLPLLGSFGEMLGGLGSKIMPFVSSMAAMVAGFAALGVIEDAINEVRNFTDSLVELNIQTEKNQFSWRYLYGGGNNARGAAIAQGIADWTKSFSMQIPYTRQDLLNAVSGLAPMGLSAAGLEHYMPMIADLAATRDPNANLAQVAQVIMSASMGYTRMLKYDLKINPEDLIQYGLNARGSGIGLHINDPSTLLPALENYTKAKGLAGAAKDISTQTWWGAWSSFMDRIQNFELDSGSGLFKNMKNDLNDLSAWIDSHSAQINRFADLLSGTLGGAFKSVATDVGDFISGVSQSGLFSALFPDSAAPAKLPPAPGPHSPVINKKASYRANRLAGADQQASQAALLPDKPPDLTPWQQFGKILGDIATTLGQAKDFAAQFFNAIDTKGGTQPGALKTIGDTLAEIGSAITPEDRAVIKDVLGLILMFVLGPTLGILEGIASVLQVIVWWMNNAEPAILGLANTIMGALGSAVTWITARFGDLISRIKDLLTWLHILPANYGGLGVSATPKGSERAAPGPAHSARASLNLNGGYGGAAVAVHATTINIHGAGTAEMLKVIDYATAKNAAAADSQSRASSGYGAYTFGTLGGLR